MLLERHAGQVFDFGARPSAILSNEKSQPGEQGANTSTNLKKSWPGWLQGGNSEPLILPDGWKFEPP